MAKKEKEIQVFHFPKETNGEKISKILLEKPMLVTAEGIPNILYVREIVETEDAIYLKAYQG